MYMSKGPAPLDELLDPSLPYTVELSTLALLVTHIARLDTALIRPMTSRNLGPLTGIGLHIVDEWIHLGGINAFTAL
jgi:hypothetical protein